MKVMAGEGLPHFDPALLDSGKSAAIDGLLMLLVVSCPYHSRSARQRSCFPAMSGSRMSFRGAGRSDPIGKRTVSLKLMDFALGEQLFASGYSAHLLLES